MLEIFDQNPQSRVFHVDRECYIVYLGAHWEDYKPFLRLGTSTTLPPDLPPIVSTIVVPDVLTGNPLDEPVCLAGDATPDTHYVGDLETVEHMKRFVGQNAIPVEAIEAVDHEEDDGKHVLVYYYRDGNLKIKYRKSEVLDLRRREKLDGHFVARAQDAKNEYGRSPFKLPGESYQAPGFVVLEGSAYLVSRGELAALRLTDDYFFRLCAAGIDADRISTVQAEDADTALIRFFKRSRTKNRPIRVSTPRKERIDDAVELFPENSLPALRAKVIDGNGASFEFHRFRVTREPGRFEAAIEGLEGPVVFGSAGKKRGDASIMVDPTAGTMTLAPERGSVPVVEGALYQVVQEKLTRGAIEEAFLPGQSYPWRDLLTPAENALLGQLQYFFVELFAGRDTGKVLRTIRGLDPTKAIGRPDSGIHPVAQVVLHNYREYARYLRNHEADAAKGAEGLSSLLDRHQVTRADVPAGLPLVGEIRREGDHAYLFYRFVSRITSDRYAHAERVAEKIGALPAIDYEAERRRLADLIAGLATPEQMDEARMRRIAEAKEKKARKPAAAAATTGAGDSGSEQRDANRDGASRAGSAAARPQSATASRAAASRAAAGRPRSGRGRDRRRWVLPGVAGLLLLIALLLLLLTGTIPNPWFDGTWLAGVFDRTAVSDASDAEVPSDEPGRETPADEGRTDEGAIGAEDEIASADDEEAARTDQARPDAEDDEAGTGESTGTTGETGEAEPGDRTTDEPGETGTAADDETGPRPGEADETAAPEGEPAEPERTESEPAEPEPRLPEGWPPDSLPAIRALENTPGVTITRTRVIGPGGIEITLRDIIVLVNRIAVDNGYATMDEVNPRRPDPDWIYPGNVFVLPNETRYTVVSGDTLWEITVRYMVARLRQDYERYTELVAEYQAEGTADARRSEIVDELESIADSSHTENFSRLVEETLDRWRE